MRWTFDEAQRFAYGFIRPTRRPIDRQRPARARRLLALAGLRPSIRVVQVVGTKGKGSTSALLAAALQAQGLRVGLYTSPHLQHLTERVRIDGAPIAPQVLADHLQALEAACRAVPDLAFTEVMLAAALRAFQQAGVDWAVMEAHLGGRYDATQALQPDLCLVTTLGHDHTDLLGESLAEIAWHKAGALRPGVPALSAPQPPQAAAVLREEALRVGAPLTFVGEDTGADWPYEALPPSLEGQAIRQGGRLWRCGLIGAHQASNLALAVAALESLAQGGLAWTPAQAQIGLQGTRWPGRFERAADDPPLILDGAHNPESAQALAEALRALYPGRPVGLIYGAKPSKDSAAMLGALLPLAGAVWMIAPQPTEADSRPADAPALAELARSLGYAGLLATPATLAETLEQARRWAGQAQGVALLCGSLYLVGEARAILGLDTA
jgi:dihydrofolate synthase/folylpolyglutamate synthase